jgi:nucleotide-binding universal stress UspA family protein
MSYATLMVNVDVERDCRGRVSVAAGLADLFNAHLIGVAGWAPMSLFLAKEGPADPAPTQPHLQDMKTLLDQKGEQFCAAVDARGRRAEWRSVLELPTEAVAREARAADLVIVGQDGDTDDPFRALDPGSLILTEAVVHVEPTAPLTRVLQLMVNLKARSFPVMSPGHQLVGIISREDVMRALRQATQGPR